MSRTIPMAISLSKDVSDKIYDQIVKVVESCGYKLIPSETDQTTDVSEYQYFDLKPKKASHLKIVK